MKKLEINQMEIVGGLMSYDNCVKTSAGLGLILLGPIGMVWGLLGGLADCTCPIQGC